MDYEDGERVKSEEWDGLKQTISPTLMPDLQMLNGGGRNILPGGAFSNHLYINHLSSRSINVDESNGNSRNTE